jgi:hypothetical protein
MSSRRRLATPAQSLRHRCSACRGRVRRESVRVVSRSRAIPFQTQAALRQNRPGTFPAGVVSAELAGVGAGASINSRGLLPLPNLCRTNQSCRKVLRTWRAPRCLLEPPRELPCSWSDSQRNRSLRLPPPSGLFVSTKQLFASPTERLVSPTNCAVLPRYRSEVSFTSSSCQNCVSS